MVNLLLLAGLGAAGYLVYTQLHKDDGLNVSYKGSSNPKDILNKTGFMSPPGLVGSGGGSLGFPATSASVPMRSPGGFPNGLVNPLCRSNAPPQTWMPPGYRDPFPPSAPPGQQNIPSDELTGTIVYGRSQEQDNGASFTRGSVPFYNPGIAGPAPTIIKGTLAAIKTGRRAIVARGGR